MLLAGALEAGNLEAKAQATIESGLRGGAAKPRRPALPAADLAVSSYGEVAARVAAAGEPRWLIQGLWPADAYGVLAAQEKAGKTWAALDLAVSVATGRPWLDHFACPSPGPVLVFLGEGGEWATVRRIEAIATARASTPSSWPTGSGCASAFPGWPPPAPGPSWPESKPNSKLTPQRWLSSIRCIWRRLGPAARTCTTWGPSSRPSRASARLRNVRCWW